MRAHIVALAAALILPTASIAGPADGFVFAGTEVRGPFPGQVITLRGRTSLTELTEKLTPYSVKLSDECDGSCIEVSDDKRQLIQIYLDEKTGVISGITSYDPGTLDTRGNKIGDNLSNAIGDQPVVCNRGESTFCISKPVPGLSYVPSYGGTCGVVPVSGSQTLFNIPRCVKIEGFGIWRER